MTSFMVEVRESYCQNLVWFVFSMAIQKGRDSNGDIGVSGLSETVRGDNNGITLYCDTE